LRLSRQSKEVFVHRSSTTLACLALALIPTPVMAKTTITGDLPRKDNRPLEANAGLETEYSVVRARDGTRLRAILTRPQGTKGRLPAVFFTQEVSCETVEFEPGQPSRLQMIANRIGKVLIRIDRSGSGDSEGPGCDKLDYNTEVAHYRDAFDQLSKHPWVDPARIVIYGSSLGSTVAPLVAEDKKVAGVVVQGAGAVTYLERMIGFDRLNLERSGRFAVDRVHPEMLRRIRFQIHYLLEKKTPDQVVAEHPDLAGVWDSLLGTDAKPHYGRPHAWHWQAAERDFLTAWTKVNAPVMVVFGEYEQFEMRHGHRVIVDTVNALRPGTATWLEIPQAGHDLRIYPDPKTAYSFSGGERRPELFIAPVVAWIDQVTGR
jgi:pimeloyl-ACP methyl ester carboxylesterase